MMGCFFILAEVGKCHVDRGDFSEDRLSILSQCICYRYVYYISYPRAKLSQIPKEYMHLTTTDLCTLLTLPTSILFVLYPRGFEGVYRI